MTTLQEYLNQKYPLQIDKELSVREIILNWISPEAKEKGLGELEGGELDLRKFKGVEGVLLEKCFLKTPITKINVSGLSNLLMLVLSYNNLTSIDLSGCVNLVKLVINNNNLTSIDFLKTLPNPEKLEVLKIYDNNIQPTTLDFLRPFVNLKDCRLGLNFSGPWQENLANNKYNRFYGTLEPIKNLAKLEKFCVAGTDIEEGLEYIPSKIAELSKGKGEEAMELNLIDCQPLRENAKVKKIKDELCAFDYDIEAWQLAHPHKVHKAKPKIFFDPEVKNKWLNALRDKTNKTAEKLNQTKQNEPDKNKRIKRLEMKLDNLKLIQENISNHALIDKLQSKKLVKMEDKATQTEELLEYKIPGSWSSKR